MFLLTVNHLKVLLLICYLLVALGIIFFSWLYLLRTTRVTKAIGLQAPEYIKILVRISIFNALFTACLTIVFLLTNYY